MNLLSDPHNTYCGYIATQTWADFWLWEQFLHIARPATVIELGTGEGGFSLFLKHQAEQRQFQFHTIDNDTWVGFEGRKPHRGMLLNHFIKADIFNSSIVESLLEQSVGPTVLICDNGDKPREVHDFSYLLEQDDYLVVHDWDREITINDIPEIFSFILHEECIELESWTRFFQCE